MRVEALVLAVTMLTLEVRVIAPLPDEAVTSVSEAVVVEVVEDEEEEGEEEVEEAVSVPKTKAGMIKALYDQLSAMKKSDLSDSFSKRVHELYVRLMPFSQVLSF